jgi:enamine deaminase RidA (YjgF/YER057c/UK114 family)
MDKYNIISPATTGSFSQQLSALADQLGDLLSAERQAGRQLHYTKVFLSDSANQEPLLMASPLMTEHLQQAAYTIIQQPPLNGAKIVLLVKTSDTTDDFVLHSIRLTDQEAANQSSYVQTVMLFDKYIEATRHLNTTLKNHCVRTWIYVRDIDANYAGVVRARNDIFRQHGLSIETHFIASTGIGGRTGERKVLVAMDFLTCPNIQPDQKTYLQALTHLNPTHEYGVAFERATRLTLSNDRQLFLVSGTASINHRGEVINEGNVTKQADRLLENISALLSDGGATLNDVRYFIIYLRDLSDAQVIEDYMSKAWPDVPHLITHAKVCRPAWLVEMECIAEKAL